jgi:hypothetical protein
MSRLDCHAVARRRVRRSFHSPGLWETECQCGCRNSGAVGVPRGLRKLLDLVPALHTDDLAAIDPATVLAKQEGVSPQIASEYAA